MEDLHKGGVPCFVGNEALSNWYYTIILIIPRVKTSPKNHSSFWNRFQSPVQSRCDSIPGTASCCLPQIKGNDRAPLTQGSGNKDQNKGLRLGRLPFITRNITHDSRSV
jgi:hypothetical protein